VQVDELPILAHTGSVDSVRSEPTTLQLVAGMDLALEPSRGEGVELFAVDPQQAMARMQRQRELPRNGYYASERSLLAAST
jgi:hypothetical protein